MKKTIMRFWIVAVMVMIAFSACGDNTAVTFIDVTANGSVSQTTTQLTLTFSKAIKGLSVADITLSRVFGVTRGTFDGSGPTYTLDINVYYAGGSLDVAVSKSGYTIIDSPKTVTIYYYRSSDESITSPTEESITSPTGIELVSIPAGTFTMGSPETEPDRDSDETQFSVTLSGFKMSKYQVTQAQYQAVMGTYPSKFTSAVSGESETPDRLPVEMVTWYDAVEFCNKLSVLEELEPVYTISDRTPPSWFPEFSITHATVTADFTKNGYRLPTEAQWEYACRAGTTTAYNTGETISGNTGWYDSNSGNETHQVGLNPANAWGLYDMHGNVWEWCWDLYDSYPSTSQNDPIGASSGTDRVLRGGSWYHSAENLRSASRFKGSPSIWLDDLGFRLVRP